MKCFVVLLLTDCCCSHGERDHLINHFFSLNYSYSEIFLVLLVYHNISVSLRNLKRLLHRWKFNRRKNWSPLNEIFIALKEELTSSGVISWVQIDVAET